MMETPALNEATLFGDARPTAPNILSDKFILPPFSTLDARGGEWQSRKGRWLSALDMNRHESDGRADNLAGNFGDGSLKFTDGRAAPPGRGTSVFDPVLCELIYAWFSRPGDLVLDPFAGGAVRGLVAGLMDRQYLGIDLRSQQVAENEARASLVAETARPRWLVADGTYLADDERIATQVDLVFSCPPYGWLERYSDDPRDLSTMSLPEFMQAHARAITQVVSRLRRHRFAVWVVGDYRDKQGCYVGFPSQTVRAFESAGLRLYNEAVYLESGLVTAAMRASKQFGATRKQVKVHQNVLVFVKGDPKLAAAYVRNEAVA